MVTFAQLQCPKCKARGTVQTLPWQTAAGETFGLSILCSACDRFGILDLREATEVTFEELNDG